MAEIDDALDSLYIARSMLQDIYIPVLKKFPAGSDERDDFLRVKGAIDAAIVDLENQALGTIAKRMVEAKPDIESAVKGLKKNLKKLGKVQGVAKKITKAFGHLEKAAGLFL